MSLEKLIANPDPRLTEITQGIISEATRYEMLYSELKNSFQSLSDLIETYEKSRFELLKKFLAQEQLAWCGLCGKIFPEAKITFFYRHQAFLTTEDYAYGTRSHDIRKGCQSCKQYYDQIMDKKLSSRKCWPVAFPSSDSQSDTYISKIEAMTLKGMLTYRYNNGNLLPKNVTEVFLPDKISVELQHECKLPPKIWIYHGKLMASYFDGTEPEFLYISEEEVRTGKLFKPFANKITGD